MGATDERNHLVRLGEREKGVGEVGHFKGEGVELVAHVQADVDGDLVVAAAAGVDLFAEVSEAFGQAALNGEVHVPVGGGNGEFSATGFFNDIFEGPEDGDALLFGEEGGLEVHAREHGDMGGGAEAVDFCEGEVENGVFTFGEGEDVGVDFANGGGGICGLHCTSPVGVGERKTPSAGTSEASYRRGLVSKCLSRKTRASSAWARRVL